MASNGMTVPASQRALDTLPNIVSLDLPSGRTQAFYLQANSPMGHLDAQVFRLSYLRARLFQDALVLAGTLALLLVMALYNLLLFASLRDRSYLTYSAFLGCLGAYLLTLSPMVFYLAHTLRSLISIITLAGAGSVLLFIQFIRQFLLTRKRFPSWDRFWRWYRAPIALILAGRLLAPASSWLRMAELLLFFVAAILVLVFAVKAWRSGFVPARHYLQANLVFIAFYLITLAPNLMKVDLGMLPDFSLQIGIALQVVLFSLALGGDSGS